MFPTKVDTFSSLPPLMIIVCLCLGRPTAALNTIRGLGASGGRGGGQLVVLLVMVVVVMVMAAAIVVVGVMVAVVTAAVTRFEIMKWW